LEIGFLTLFGLSQFLTKLYTEFADISHSHTKSQITDFPTSLKNPSSLTVQFNGVTNKTYDGSSAQIINITPSAIGVTTEIISSKEPTSQKVNDYWIQEY